MSWSTRMEVAPEGAFPASTEDRIVSQEAICLLGYIFRG